jgi:hypothetical protein
MDALPQALLLADAILIGPFRWLSEPLLGFYLGSFLLAMWAVVGGELTISLAIRFNRAHIQRLNREVALKEALSIAAYQRGDRDGYQALNKAANDAWGKHFFTMAAYSAGILWPLPFALAWMQTRFAAVDFPIAWPFALMTDAVGYNFVFIPIYILCRILFGRLRPHLPYFRGVHLSLAEAQTQTVRVLAAQA